MSLKCKCRSCGHVFPWNVISFSPDAVVESAYVENCITTCERCGGDADVQSGSFSFRDGVLTTFSASGVTRENILAVKDIAEKYQAGKITHSTAAVEIANINSSFVKMWNWTNDNAGAIGVLLAIIALFLNHYYWTDSSGSAYSDQKASQRQSEALEKIREEIESQSDILQSLGKPVPIRPTAQPKSRKQASGKPNRQQRRKTAAIERRNKKK